MNRTDQAAAEIGKPFDPIFVVGCERSGTTLLRVLLDRHSLVAVTEETQFFPRIYDRHRADRHNRDHDTLFGLIRDDERMANQQMDRALILPRFKRYPPDFKYLFRSVLEEYAAQYQMPRVVEKSPCHLAHVGQIIEWFPTARVLCIVRDGRDVVRSLMKVHWTRKDPRLQSMVWRWAAAEGLRLVKRYPRHFMQIRFEDLLRQPQQTLRRVDQFIGVPFEEQQLSPDTATKFDLQKIALHQKTLEPLDPSRIGAWKQDTPEPQKWLMNSMMGTYLRRLDYPDADMRTCPLHRRLYHHVHNLGYRCGAWGPTSRLRLARCRTG